MLPIDRFKKTITEGNLWIYVLSLAKSEEICNDDVSRLVFEKHGFLPNAFLVATVMFKLHRQGMISNERHLSKKAYKATEQGIEQLSRLQIYLKELNEKLAQ